VHLSDALAKDAYHARARRADLKGRRFGARASFRYDKKKMPSEDKSQRHYGEDAKAQNGKSEWIVRGNLEHRGSSTNQRSYYSPIYRIAGSLPLTAVVPPAFTSGAVPRSRSPMRA
jgi:hypothetical protein